MHKTGVHNKDNMWRPIMLGSLIGLALTLGLAALCALLIAKGTVAEGMMEQLSLVCAAVGAAVAAFITTAGGGRRIVLSAIISGAALSFILALIGAALGASPLQGMSPKLLIVVVLCSLAVGVMRAMSRGKRR